MAGPNPDGTTPQRPLGTAMRRAPTGAKIFLILAVILFFPAIIAFFASARTTEMASEQLRSQLRVAASESARKLAIELVGDMTALRVSMDALVKDPGDAPSCARVQGVFADRTLSGARFEIIDRSGRVICGSALPATIAAQRPRSDLPITARLLPDLGVTLSILDRGGRFRGAAFFPLALLAERSRSAVLDQPYEELLTAGETSAVVTALPDREALERRERYRLPLGIDNLVLATSIRAAPLTSAVLLAMLLPLVMWLAAAGISWFVVDRLLIRPLRDLRRRVAAYRPGELIDPGELSILPAQEIRELGETFHAISATVAAHEAGLAEGLIRQTKLTREVHHRVKNNLQVISSLINFHARGARSPEATGAYASIQRRVDALAVVHRHHFAELEDNRGLSLRAVLGELAANIRATAPEGAISMSLVLEVTPLHVSQDVAVAVAFLITELIELAVSLNPAGQIRISAKPGETPLQGIVRVSSPGLVENEEMQAALRDRYGRIIEGLARQLRSRLHHDPLVGAYEIVVPILSVE